MTVLCTGRDHHIVRSYRIDNASANSSRRIIAMKVCPMMGPPNNIGVQSGAMLVQQSTPGSGHSVATYQNPGASNFEQCDGTGEISMLSYVRLGELAISGRY